MTAVVPMPMVASPGVVLNGVPKAPGSVEAIVPVRLPPTMPPSGPPAPINPAGNPVFGSTEPCAAALVGCPVVAAQAGILAGSLAAILANISPAVGPPAILKFGV